jgi:wyosine [tRNA(Phe)-imidazoG37] synthetase (radical SAM superfamily)
MSHVFGPVPSRRLGFSLGVDPVAPKTCTMDCVYCELGRTTDRTVSRARFVDLDAMLGELEKRLKECPRLDFITVSGSGEPTLSEDLGRLIDGIRRLSEVPVAVLTNGSLLGDPDVCSELARAAVVAPSLDAVTVDAFQAVNRPHPSLDPAAIARSVAEFTRRFGGEVWLESLFVKGLNDDPEEVERMARAIDAIGPARVHVNTIARPPADPDARPVEPAQLGEIARRLWPRAEVIAPFEERAQPRVAGDAEEVIVAMAARRPVTVDDVAKATGTSLADAAKRLSALVENGRLELVRHAETLYYKA